MQDTDRQIALELRTQLEPIVPILDFRIFGSRAGNHAREDSDLDIFIKVSEIDRPLREKIHDIAWEVGFEHDHIISTFVVTEAQIQTGAVGASPIMSKVLDEGIAI